MYATCRNVTNANVFLLPAWQHMQDGSGHLEDSDSVRDEDTDEQSEEEGYEDSDKDSD